jgi:peptidyl-tRNA hydrolase, PTH2 family
MPLPDDEVVQYLIFRADLGLPKGKIAAQGGHAVQLAIRAVERSGNEHARRYLADWEAGSYTKIALKVANAAELEVLGATLTAAGIIHARVVDEGRTVIEPGTVTVVGLQPLPRSLAAAYVSALRLL